MSELLNNQSRQGYNDVMSQVKSRWKHYAKSYGFFSLQNASKEGIARFQPTYMLRIFSILHSPLLL